MEDSRINVSMRIMAAKELVKIAKSLVCENVTAASKMFPTLDEMEKFIWKSQTMRKLHDEVKKDPKALNAFNDFLMAYSKFTTSLLAIETSKK